MDTYLILLCQYDGVTAVIRIYENWTYKDLIQSICAKWNVINGDALILRYCLPGHPSCMLENDEDVNLMFSVVTSQSIKQVDLFVSDCNIVSQQKEIHDGQCSIGATSLGCDESQWSLEYARSQEIMLSFVSHPDKSLLSAPWANGIQSVGQKFEGGAAHFRNVLCKYAVECGFQFVYICNDSSRVTASCKFKGSGCGWFVHARILPANGYFYIKKLDNVHSCGSAVRTGKNERMTSDLIGSLIMDAVRSNPLKRPIDVVKEFKSHYGLDISYYQAYMAVDKAKGDIYGDFSLSFDQLRWYIDAVRTTNPGSVIMLDCDSSTHHFKRIFIAYGASILGFNYCRPLIFLDGTFLKGRYKGILLSATAKDANQGLYPICMAVVDAENKENWRWFLLQLSSVIEHSREITFLSDRNLGLLDAVNLVFPNAFHGFCLQHLKRNLRNHLRGRFNGFRERMVCLFDRCAYAPNIDVFNICLNELLREGGEKVKNFVDDLPFEHWSHAHFRGCRYGETSSNAAESFNSWIREERHLPITSMLDAIRVRLMRQIATRRETSTKWSSVVCPAIDDKLKNGFNDSRTWNVSLSGDGLYEVHSVPSVAVDLVHHTCSCGSWQIHRIPCAHAIAAVQKSGHNLDGYVDRYYHVQTYRDIYASSIYPVPTIWKTAMNDGDGVVLPPISRKQPGRPKKNRIASNGEKVRPIKCGRCGKLGNHNRKSCNEAL